MRSYSRGITPPITTNDGLCNSLQIIINSIEAGDHDEALLQAVDLLDTVHGRANPYASALGERETAFKSQIVLLRHKLAFAMRALDNITIDAPRQAPTGWSDVPLFKHWLDLGWRSAKFDAATHCRVAKSQIAELTRAGHSVQSPAELREIASAISLPRDAPP